MDDFDIPQNKMAESAERVVDRAVDEARRRDHGLLTNEHVCLAFAQVEWDMNVIRVATMTIQKHS